MNGTFQQRTILGYHMLGEYHYSTLLFENCEFYGKDVESDFKSIEAFISLVTSVHEHYHVMQELVQGYFLYRYVMHEEITAALIEGKATTSNNKIINVTVQTF